MATRRLLTHAFQEREMFRIAQNALHGHGPAEIVEFQRIDPWFLKRHGVVMPAESHDRPPVLHDGRRREELKNLNNAARDRLRLEAVPERKKSVDEGRRLLRLVQMDSLIKRLRRMPHACISCNELLQICTDSLGKEDAKEVVKSLDESGQILIVGNYVLRPEKVARVMEKILHQLNNPRTEEVEEMKKQKAKIDAEAEKLVRRELWGVFGFMSIQTAYLLRVTFWELSWDVMEPICYFLTSTYYLAGYAFFLATSTNPTFESIFQARFKSRQEQLMKKRNFDIERFEELRMIAGVRLRGNLQERSPRCDLGRCQ